MKEGESERVREGQKSWLADCSLYILHRICDGERLREQESCSVGGGNTEKEFTFNYSCSFEAEEEEAEKIICQTTS